MTPRALPTLLLLLLAPLASAQQPAPDRDPEADQRKAFADLLGERWFTIRMRRSRVGWRQWKLTRVDQPTPAYVSHDVGVLRLRTDGNVSTTRYDETWRFDGEAPHRLQSIDARVTSDGERTHLRCWLADGRWRVEQRVGGELVVERKLDPPKATFADYLRPQLAIRAGAKPGAHWDVPSFSTDDLRHETERIELVAIDRAQDQPARWHFRGTQQDGTRYDYWLDASGRVLRVALGSILELVRARSAADAKQLDDDFDVLDDMLVRVPPLGPPEHVERLRLRVRGVPVDQLPQTPRQRLVARDGEGDQASAVVLLTRRPYQAPKAGAEPAKLDDDAREKALAESPALPIAHPRIVALARQLTDGKPPHEAARAINRWVYEQLEKDYRSDASNALTVLDQRSGDCTEHALLFIALARAAKLPAREVGGLVYLWDDDTSAFGYHAWVEVWLPGGWHEMDPSWGEDAINATHLRLTIDPEREGLALNLTGAIRLEPTADGPAPTERVHLRDGRALPATLVGVDPDGALRLHTPSAQLRLPRALVDRVEFDYRPRRVDGNRLIDDALRFQLDAPGWTIRAGKTLPDDAPEHAIALLSGQGVSAILYARETDQTLDAFATARARQLAPRLRETRRRSYRLGDQAVDERLLLAREGTRVYLQSCIVRNGHALRLLAWTETADGADTALARARQLLAGLRWD